MVFSNIINGLDFFSEADKAILACDSNVTFRWFTCIGEASTEKVLLSNDSYIKNNEVQLFEDSQYVQCNILGKKNIILFDEFFDFGSVFLLDCKTLFRMAR